MSLLSRAIRRVQLSRRIRAIHFACRRLRRRVILHVGTHKTGTTSIQTYLRDNARRFEKYGVGFYPGLLHRENHLELPMVTQRRGRTSASRSRYPNLDLDELTDRTRKQIAKFLSDRSLHTFIFSSEDLSMLRHADETSALSALFDADIDVEVLLYLRNKRSYLESYTHQLTKMGIPFSNDPQDFNYVKEDTWLLDYETLIMAYASSFRSIRVMSYEAETERSGGNVIGSFVSHLAIPEKALANYNCYSLNVRNAPAAAA
jgi:hypothetical protein